MSRRPSSRFDADVTISVLEPSVSRSHGPDKMDIDDAPRQTHLPLRRPNDYGHRQSEPYAPPRDVSAGPPASTYPPQAPRRMGPPNSAYRGPPPSDEAASLVTKTSKMRGFPEQEPPHANPSPPPHIPGAGGPSRGRAPAAPRVGLEVYANDERRAGYEPLSQFQETQGSRAPSYEPRRVCYYTIHPM